MINFDEINRRENEWNQYMQKKGKQGPPCLKCKNVNTVSMLIQRKSNDEISQSYNTCNKCEFTWWTKS